MVLVEEYNILTRLIHSFIIEYIKNKDYVSLKIFFYLLQKNLLKIEKRDPLLVINKEHMAESCGISSRVLINHLKKIQSLTLTLENKVDNRMEYFTLFASLSISLDEDRVELYMLKDHYVALYKVLERYLNLDFSSLFILKSLDAIKMFELLETIDEEGEYTLYELNRLFNKNYKSSKELAKKFLVPLAKELDEDLNFSFSCELLEDERISPLFILKDEYRSIKQRKNKNLIAFLSWIDNYKSLQLIHGKVSEEELDENAKWQEKVTLKMDKLAHYLGF